MDPLPHGGEVRCVDFSPDGRYLLTASFDNTVRVWDLEQPGRLPLQLRHADWVVRAQFANSSSEVVSAAKDGTARLWRLPQPEQALALVSHRARVRHAEFSSNGRMVVTASEDGTARIWSASTGRPLTAPLPHDGEVRIARFSPDGSQIACGDSSGRVKLWSTVDGSLSFALECGLAVLDLSFSRDGSMIVTAAAASGRGGRVSTWSAATGVLLCRVVESSEMIHRARFSDDGSRVITAGRRREPIRILDSRTGRLISRISRIGRDDLPGGEVHHAGFRRDGELVVTATGSTVSLWRPESGLRVWNQPGHQYTVRYAEFSPDGTRVVSAGHDDTPRIWSVSTSQPLTAALEHDADVNHARFSPDGRLVVTASSDRTVCLWEAATGARVAGPLVHPFWVHDVQFSPDGTGLVVVGFDPDGDRHNQAWIWRLPQESRSIPELTRRAEFLSSRTIHRTGGLVPVAPRQLESR